MMPLTPEQQRALDEWMIEQERLKAQRDIHDSTYREYYPRGGLGGFGDVRQFEADQEEMDRIKVREGRDLVQRAARGGFRPMHPMEQIREFQANEPALRRGEEPNVYGPLGRKRRSGLGVATRTRGPAPELPTDFEIEEPESADVEDRMEPMGEPPASRMLDLSDQSIEKLMALPDEDLDSVLSTFSDDENKRITAAVRKYRAKTERIPIDQRSPTAQPSIRSPLQAQTPPPAPPAPRPAPPAPPTPSLFGARPPTPGQEEGMRTAAFGEALSRLPPEAQEQAGLMDVGALQPGMSLARGPELAQLQAQNIYQRGAAQAARPQRRGSMLGVMGGTEDQRLIGEEFARETGETPEQWRARRQAMRDVGQYPGFERSPDVLGALQQPLEQFQRYVGRPIAETGADFLQRYMGALGADPGRQAQMQLVFRRYSGLLAGSQFEASMSDEDKQKALGELIDNYGSVGKDLVLGGVELLGELPLVLTGTGTAASVYSGVARGVMSRLPAVLVNRAPTLATLLASGSALSAVGAVEGGVIGFAEGLVRPGMDPIERGSMGAALGAVGAPALVGGAVGSFGLAAGAVGFAGTAARFARFKGVAFKESLLNLSTDIQNLIVDTQALRGGQPSDWPLRHLGLSEIRPGAAFVVKGENGLEGVFTQLDGTPVGVSSIPLDSAESAAKFAAEMRKHGLQYQTSPEAAELLMRAPVDVQSALTARPDPPPKAAPGKRKEAIGARLQRLGLEKTQKDRVVEAAKQPGKVPMPRADDPALPIMPTGKAVILETESGLKLQHVPEEEPVSPNSPHRMGDMVEAALSADKPPVRGFVKAISDDGKVLTIEAPGDIDPSKPRRLTVNADNVYKIDADREQAKLVTRALRVMQTQKAAASGAPTPARVASVTAREREILAGIGVINSKSVMRKFKIGEVEAEMFISEMGQRGLVERTKAGGWKRTLEGQRIGAMTAGVPLEQQSKALRKEAVPVVPVEPVPVEPAKLDPKTLLDALGGEATEDKMIERLAGALEISRTHAAAVLADLKAKGLLVPAAGGRVRLAGAAPAPAAPKAQPAKPAAAPPVPKAAPSSAGAPPAQAAPAPPPGAPPPAASPVQPPKVAQAAPPPPPTKAQLMADYKATPGDLVYAGKPAHLRTRIGKVVAVDVNKSEATVAFPDGSRGTFAMDTIAPTAPPGYLKDTDILNGIPTPFPQAGLLRYISPGQAQMVWDVANMFSVLKNRAKGVAWKALSGFLPNHFKPLIGDLSPHAAQEIGMMVARGEAAAHLHHARDEIVRRMRKEMPARTLFDKAATDMGKIGTVMPGGGAYTIQDFANAHPDVGADLLHFTDNIRHEIDRLDKFIMTHGGQSAPSLIAMRETGQMDSYLARMYRVHYLARGDWEKILPDETFVKAIDFLVGEAEKRGFTDWTSTTIEGALNDILQSDEPIMAFVKHDLSRPFSHLLERGELPGPIKDLLGYETSGALRMAISLSSQRSIAASLSVWDEIFKARITDSLGQEINHLWSPGKRPDTPVPVPDNPRFYGRAAGGWVIQDLKPLVDMIKPNTGMGAAALRSTGAWFKSNVLILGGPIPYMNQAARNFKGLVLSGAINPGKPWEAGQHAVKALTDFINWHKNPTDPFGHSMLAEARRTGELPRGFGHMEAVPHAQGRIFRDLADQLGTLKNKDFFHIHRAVIEVFQKYQDVRGLGAALYDFIEQWAKLTAKYSLRSKFLAEAANPAVPKWFGGKWLTGTVLTGDDAIKWAAIQSAYRIKQHFPDFENVGRYTEAMRRTPFGAVAPFISGFMEDLRVSGMSVTSAVADAWRGVKGEPQLDPGLKWRIMAYAAAHYGMKSGLPALALLRGISKEDQDAALKARTDRDQMYRPGLTVLPMRDAQHRPILYDLAQPFPEYQMLYGHPDDPTWKNIMMNLILQPVQGLPQEKFARSFFENVGFVRPVGGKGARLIEGNTGFTQMLFAAAQAGALPRAPYVYHETWRKAGLVGPGPQKLEEPFTKGIAAARSFGLNVLPSGTVPGRTLAPDGSLAFESPQEEALIVEFLSQFKDLRSQIYAVEGKKWREDPAEDRAFKDYLVNAIISRLLQEAAQNEQKLQMMMGAGEQGPVEGQPQQQQQPQQRRQ